VPYVEIFLNHIAPIFLSASTGFVLGRRVRPDLKTVSRLAFYIFSPCLIFTSITHTTIQGAELGRITLFTLGIVGVMTSLAFATGLALRLERRTLVALVIAAVFVNGGNYGLAVNQFAFGDEALARAVLYYVFSSLSVYTLGVIVAASGRPSASVWRAMGRALVSLPTTYALIAAGLIRLLGWSLPVVLDRPISLLSQAAIPVMLVLLGLQIAEARDGAWPRSRLGLILVASFLQLVIAPLVGLGLASALSLAGVTRQALVLEAAMPTAVITTILAVEYDLDTTFVTGTVVLSTLLSPLTLTPLIAYLQR